MQLSVSIAGRRDGGARRILQLLAACALATTAIFLPPIAPAYACVPTIMPPHANEFTPAGTYAAERTQAASVVFEGTVISSDLQDNIRQTVIVQVHRYYKSTGSTPGAVTLEGYNIINCLQHVSMGERLIFYATGDPAGILVATHNTSPVSDETTNAAINAAGQPPLPPNPTSRSSTHITQIDIPTLAGGVALVAVTLGVVASAGFAMLVARLKAANRPRRN